MAVILCLRLPKSLCCINELKFIPIKHTLIQYAGKYGSVSVVNFGTSTYCFVFRKITANNDMHILKYL